MEELRIIIEALAGVALSIGGFFVGKRKSDAEATETAFSAYNVALEALRNEITKNNERWQEIRNELEQKIQEQGKRITELERENKSLKIQIEKLS